MATLTASTQAPLIKSFIRGGDYTFEISVTDKDGSPFDLTGSTIFFTMNTSPTPAVDSSDSSAALKASTNSFDDPTSGVASLAIPSTDTSTLAEGDYYYDIKLKDSNGNMTPLGKNKIKVEDNITTRTS